MQELHTVEEVQVAQPFNRIAQVEHFEDELTAKELLEQARQTVVELQFVHSGINDEHGSH